MKNPLFSIKLIHTAKTLFTQLFSTCVLVHWITVVLNTVHKKKLWVPTKPLSSKEFHKIMGVLKSIWCSALFTHQDYHQSIMFSKKRTAWSLFSVYLANQKKNLFTISIRCVLTNKYSISNKECGKPLIKLASFFLLTLLDFIPVEVGIRG